MQQKPHAEKGHSLKTKDLEKIQDGVGFLADVCNEVERVLVGQKDLVRGLLIGILADGHILVEGVPGLAKTLAVHALATAFGGSFHRVQFTPDLLPSDLLGTHVYDNRTGEWSVKEGPIFANFVLADEINRAPAKVQSALLEAMQEKQVTLAGESRTLPKPFLVLATQNPLEQEGTYNLPEAQLDRFMLKLVVNYPMRDEEDEIIQRMANNEHKPQVQKIATPRQILEARSLLDLIYLDDLARGYILDLVAATRSPENFGLPELQPLILYGASPRASISLAKASRARALIEGRNHVLPDDIQEVALDVLRHRVLTTYEAEAEGKTSEDLIHEVLQKVRVP
jgi:MoxR-like ATPase